MKVRITDLMDLYEDENCPLKPVGEAETDGAPSAPTGAEAGAFGEVNDVKQSKYPFGWKQALSLAAVLGLLILSGFGVRWLMNRSAAPGSPGESSTVTPIESRDADWEPLAGEELEALSRFLSAFANQNIRNVPAEDLNSPGSLIHFAFVWRRNNDCESITVQEGPNGYTDTLTLEQINEVLDPILGKTVELPENDPGIVNRAPGMDFDYSEQLGREAGSVFYSDGCFWDQPARSDTSFFFALATAFAPDMNTGREQVLFRVYYVNYERWGAIDMAAMSALSTAEAEALEAEDKLILTATGSAELERNGDGYRLLSYVTEPTAQRPDEPEPETESLTEPDTTFAPEEDPALLAELEALFSDPQSWYSRALSSSYAVPADVDLYLFFYDGLGDGAYASDEELRQIYKPDAFEDGHFMGPPVDRMDRAGMDEVLKQIFGLDLDRSSKRGLDRFHYLEETDAYYHCHGDTNAMAREIAAARRLDDGTVLFTYRTGFWHDVADGSYPSFCTVGLRPDGKGRYQVLWNLPGEWVTAEDLGELSSLFRLSGPQRAETRDADGTVTVRELDFLEDGELRYREGDPESEFSYWASGSWWIDKDLSFRCVFCEEEEDGSRIGEWYAASYACALDGDALILTQQSKTGFAGDSIGTVIRFEQSPDRSEESSGGKTGNDYESDRPDSLEYWLTEPIGEEVFASHKEIYGMFGGRMFLGKGYRPVPDESGQMEVAPERCVLYIVTAYPDYADGGAYITGIMITDPAVEVWGLTVDSAPEDFDAVIRDMGFTAETEQAAGGEIHRAGKDGITVTFHPASRSLVFSVEVTNREGIVF